MIVRRLLSLRRPIFLSFLGLILVLIILGVPQRFMRASIFLSEIQGRPAGAWAERIVFPIRKEEVLIGSSAIPAHVYRPVMEGKTAGVVLIPGLHPKGIEEPRFILLARAIARQGITVLAPDLVDFRHFQLTEEGVTVIVRAAEFLLEQRADVDPRKVGIFGMSYSTGPALIAASRAEVADRIAFVVSVGGYFDLVNAIDYVLTGKYSLDGREVSLPPHPWARMIFSLNNLDLLATDGDAPRLREVILCWLSLDESGARKGEATLSPEGKKLLDLIIGPVHPDLYGRMARARERAKRMAVALSPSNVLTEEVLRRMRARIYLIHGAKDEVIPCSETWQLARMLDEHHHPPYAMLITRGITHVDSAEKSLTWYERLVEGAKLMRFMMTLMNER